MQGNITLGIVEVLAYVVPGCVALASILYRFFPIPLDNISKNIWLIGLFLISGFVFGQVLVPLSHLVLRFRIFVVKKILRQKSLQERYSFSPQLSKLLREYFGADINPWDEYPLSHRLVIEFMPRTTVEVDRFYAITLLSRNLVTAFFIVAVIFNSTNWGVTILSLGLMILFFLRYIHVESVTGELVMRSAYTYLTKLKNEKQSQAPAQLRRTKRVPDVGDSTQ